MTDHWHEVIAEGAFPESGKFAVKVAGWHVLIARSENGLHAINDRCTHQASMLSSGRIRRGAIMCPLHGARFDVGTGKCIGGAYRDLRVFALRIESGMIQVQVPDQPPGFEDLPNL